MERKIMTKEENLGHIFGKPLDTFDQTRPPSMLDTVRLWMSIYDRTRKESPTKNLSQNIKDNILMQVVEALTNVWLNLPREIGLIGEIKQTVKDIIKEAEKLIKCWRKKDDKDWISGQQDRFKKVVDISPVKSRPKKDTPKKLDTNEVPLIISGKRTKKGPKRRLVEEYTEPKKAKINLGEAESDDIADDENEIPDVEQFDEPPDDITDDENEPTENIDEWIIDDDCSDDESEDEEECYSNFGCTYRYKL